MIKKTLVVGGDSKIAKYLLPHLRKNNYNFISTSRRKKYLKKNIFLNLSNIRNFKIPKNIDSAIFLAFINDFYECEKRYNYAHKINCINIPILIKRLIKKNIFVCFVSTNVIFQNKKKIPKEDSLPNPKTKRGKMTLITEKKILHYVKKEKKEKFLSILRMTKNIDSNTRPFTDWIKKINKNKFFYAFKDLYFSPVTFTDSVNILFKILKKKLHGIFHISGKKDISYSDFAKKFLAYNKLNDNLAKPCLSHEKNVKLLYNHSITALNMSKTTKITKIKPIKISKIFKVLSSKIN